MCVKFTPFRFDSVIQALIYIFDTFSAEVAHIMKMTKPKIIFCDSNNVLCIRDSLKVLKITVPIFAFGGKVDGARIVEELFIPCEDDEMFW